MGCWDTSCKICSVKVDVTGLQWTKDITAILRGNNCFSAHDCIQLLSYGGTGDFFAKSYENPELGWMFCVDIVGRGWSEYPNIGIVVHTDCLDVFTSIYGQVYRETDPLYTGNMHLEELFKLELYNELQFHCDEHYKDEKFKLESPNVSHEHRSQIESILAKYITTEKSYLPKMTFVD